MRRRNQPKRPVPKQRTPLSDPTPEGFADIAARAGTVAEVRLLWANAKDQGALTDHVKQVMTARAEFLKGQGVA